MNSEEPEWLATVTVSSVDKEELPREIVLEETGFSADYLTLSSDLGWGLMSLHPLPSDDKPELRPECR